MDLNDIRNYVAYVVKQNSPDTKELSVQEFVDLFNVKSIMHFKNKVGLPEEYAPGNPLPTQAFEISTANTMDMEPFKVYMGGDSAPLNVNADGICDQPQDLYYPTALTYKYLRNGTLKARPVDMVTDREWSDRIGSAVMFPDKNYPICTFYSGKIRFAPKNLRYVEMSYLRLPQSVSFAFTTANGYLEYDKTNSVQTEWSDSNVIDIIHMMLQDIGINISRGDVYNHVTAKMKEGR